ncbi:MAG TPA: hypothetical protein VNL18_04580 [Gemmatimonadales bacterium]|nr:hypothetical protein [Gemmatimonadales bacterium]
MATLAIAALPSLGCWPWGPEGAGWLEAKINLQLAGTRLVETYRGTGNFDADRNRLIGNRLEFVLSSATMDPTYPAEFRILGLGVGLPEPGVHPLSYLSQEQLERPSAQGFVATFIRAGEGFIATSGEIEISESSGDRIVGTFHFVGFLYCPVHGGCVVPAAPPEDAATVEVEGAFEAHPMVTSGEPIG